MFDVILAAVTLASLGLAAVMGIVTWQVLSRERRRFDARVEELSSAAAEPDQLGAKFKSVPVPPALVAAPDVCPDAPGSQPGLFAEPSLVTSNGRRLAIAAGLGFAVVVLAFAAVVLLNPVSARRAAVPLAAARVAVPIELVSLGHARTGLGLSIRGSVHNPAGGASLRDLVAVVFLFSGSGRQVGTSQAAVTATLLAPGGETPFDVPVVDGRQVARYRITFRTASSVPVPHVDRRMGPQSATPETIRVAAGRRAELSAAPAR